MPAVGGSVASITLAGRYFAVASDADLQRMLGGSVNDVQANGDESARLIKVATPWECTDVQISIDDSREDQTFLQELADRNGFFAIAATFASGVTFSGEGQITDTVNVSSANTTATLALKGPNKLAPQ